MLYFGVAWLILEVVFCLFYEFFFVVYRLFSGALDDLGSEKWLGCLTDILVATCLEMVSASGRV